MLQSGTQTVPPTMYASYFFARYEKVFRYVFIIASAFSRRTVLTGLPVGSPLVIFVIYLPISEIIALANGWERGIVPCSPEKSKYNPIFLGNTIRQGLSRGAEFLIPETYISMAFSNDWLVE